MIQRFKKSVATACSVLSRLSRDVAGNAFAIMTAAMIPLAGMVGSGIDISRMYIVKTRLQHACDAGALAGRKQMGAGVWGSDDNAAAERFFLGNYQVNIDKTGYYGSTDITYKFTENAGKVSGAASAKLPMTLTKVIGHPTETLAVTCDAEMKLPNTDVMFVLDTTGSMNCVAGDTNCPNGNNNGVPASGSKIDGLKTAVKCFYEVLAQLDTDANCTTGTPSGGTSSAVQVRFGFVPYSSNVNVGHLLRSDWFSDSWNYQTRKRSGTGTAWSDPHTIYVKYNDPDYPTSTSCPSNGYNSSSETWSSGQWLSAGGTYYCQRVSYSVKGPNWNYASLPVNSSALKSGIGWGASSSFTLPINNDASARTISWDGCVEERANWGSSPASFTALPTANDISQRPVASDANTMWHPMLPGLIFYRNHFADDYYSWSDVTTASSTTPNRYNDEASYSCPSEARLLQQWPDPVVFDSYVDSFVAVGNTYHDIGMLWGARLMWPGGIIDSAVTGPNGTAYASNTFASNGGQIQHHMIFMTDGDSTSGPCNYTSNGVLWFDRRQTSTVGDAQYCQTNAGTSTNNQALVDQINNRLATLCTLVKNQGITLWVVSYGGTGINSDTKSRLQTCASPADSVTATHYFDADDPDKLQKTFAQIANNISQLRLTK